MSPFLPDVTAGTYTNLFVEESYTLADHASASGNSGSTGNFSGSDNAMSITRTDTSEQDSASSYEYSGTADFDIDYDDGSDSGTLTSTKTKSNTSHSDSETEYNSTSGPGGSSYSSTTTFNVSSESSNTTDNSATGTLTSSDSSYYNQFGITESSESSTTTDYTSTNSSYDTKSASASGTATESGGAGGFSSSISGTYVKDQANGSSNSYEASETFTFSHTLVISGSTIVSSSSNRSTERDQLRSSSYTYHDSGNITPAGLRGTYSSDTASSGHDNWSRDETGGTSVPATTTGGTSNTEHTDTWNNTSHDEGNSVNGQAGRTMSFDRSRQRSGYEHSTSEGDTTIGSTHIHSEGDVTLTSHDNYAAAGTITITGVYSFDSFSVSQGSSSASDSTVTTDVGGLSESVKITATNLSSSLTQTGSGASGSWDSTRDYTNTVTIDGSPGTPDNPPYHAHYWGGLSLASGQPAVTSTLGSEHNGTWWGQLWSGLQIGFQITSQAIHSGVAAAANFAAQARDAVYNWDETINKVGDYFTNGGFSQFVTSDAFGNALNTTDQLFAGFGDALTGGLSTKARAAAWGTLATQNHQGTAFTIGQLAGVGVAIATGNACGMTGVVALGSRALSLAQTAGYAVGAWDSYQQGDYLGAGLNLLAGATSATNFLKPCFAAGTPLLTLDGDRPIEQFKPGDLVLSRSEFDPEGAVEAKIVEEVFTNTGRIFHLHVPNQVIRTTPEHPFYVYNKGWLRADELTIGDLLSSHDSKWVPVEDLLDTGEYETVYNLRVADYHTYFVGSREWGFSVWAHNTYRTNFFDKNPELKGEVWVHHAVEQQVLKRYPGQFTKPQLDSVGNLRGIPNEINGEFHLSFIRTAWNRFYSNYPNATAREIEHFADVIDRFVGFKFKPPI